MPRPFGHTKRGRHKNQRGGLGRGTMGRRPVGEISGDMDNGVISPTLAEVDVSDISCDTSVFQDAIGSPSGGPDIACLSDVRSPSSAVSPTPDLSSEISMSEAVVSSTPSRPVTELMESRTLTLPESNPIKSLQDVSLEGLNLLRATVPSNWIPVADHDGYHVLLLSRGENKTVQRSIFMSFSGSLKITVHRRSIHQEIMSECLKNAGQSVVLSDDTLRQFVDRLIAVVLYIRSFEICAAACDTEYKHFWKDDDSGFIDKNPYAESRYETAYRSSECHMLVPVRKWKCEECEKAAHRFRQRIVHENVADYHPNTPNIFMTEEQKLSKLEDQQKQIASQKRKIERLQDKIRSLLENEGVPLDQELSDSLEDAVKSSEILTPEQKQLRDLFLQQQHKAVSVKGKTGMRWHPIMIRFALLIKSHSTAAYNAVRESGLISLPGDRTLFDYTHTMPQVDGINFTKMQRLAEKVAKYSKDHQSYHNLLMDEIHISQKLVYLKSTGEMVGYVKLTEAEEEMRHLMHEISKDSKPEEQEPPIANKILAYMVKGITNDVKEVVASYTTNSLTKEFLFDRTWDVITHCELAGLKILSVVCDGSSVNRSFIQMHSPSRTGSKVVFSTKNMCYPDRELFFISDTPHLLKTLRNSFAKSGVHPKSTRLLTKNGQTIRWSTIVKLFLDDCEHSIRSSHKLNAANVYLNSYSRMNVKYAAQVLSNTVATDISTRNYKNTSETVTFIKNCNDFFDNLNGGHSSMGKKTANSRLDPYTSSSDKRFEELDGFVSYLREWKNEIESLPDISLKIKKKMFIADQTFEGVEMTVNAFKGAVRFMLDTAKADFIIARVFCQDPLEQYFGKQRASIGGNSAPTPYDFRSTDLKISIHRDLNVSKRSGNVEAVNSCMRINDEPLPKRRKKLSTTERPNKDN